MQQDAFKQKIHLADGIKLFGHLTLFIVDAATRKVLVRTQRNLIVDGGYAAAAQSLAGVAGAAITRVRVGESTTEPQPGDTAIAAPFETVQITGVDYPDFAVCFNFSINADTANGINIAEWGLITADGRLFSRLVRDEIIAKTNAIEILGAWTINL